MPNSSRVGITFASTLLVQALADQIAEDAGDVFDRHVGVDAVLMEEVDPLDPEPRERALDRPPHVLRPAVHGGRPAHPARIAIRTQVEAELGGDHHAVA
jgi:hypothetical protein